MCSPARSELFQGEDSRDRPVGGGLDTVTPLTSGSKRKKPSKWPWDEGDTLEHLNLLSGWATFLSLLQRNGQAWYLESESHKGTFAFHAFRSAWLTAYELLF